MLKYFFDKVLILKYVMVLGDCKKYFTIFFLLLVLQYHYQTVIGPLLGYFMNDFLSFVYK